MGAHEAQPFVGGAALLGQTALQPLDHAADRVDPLGGRQGLDVAAGPGHRRIDLRPLPAPLGLGLGGGLALQPGEVVPHRRQPRRIRGRGGRHRLEPPHGAGHVAGLLVTAGEIELGLGRLRVGGERPAQHLARLRRDRAVGRRDQGLAPVGQGLGVLALEAYEGGVGAGRVVEASEPHVDRSEHAPAAGIVRVVGEPCLDLADGGHQVLGARPGRLTVGIGLRGEVRRAVEAVHDERDEGDGREREGGGRPTLTQVRLGDRRGARCVGPLLAARPQQPARGLGPRGLGLGRGNEAAAEIALDLGELILVEAGLGREAVARRLGRSPLPAAPRHRPEQREHSCAGHGRQDEPDRRHQTQRFKLGPV